MLFKSLLVIFCFYILFFAPFTVSQNLIKDDFRVNSDGANSEHELPDIDVDASGNFVLVWQGIKNNDYDIFAQRFNFDGDFSGENFLVNNQSLRNQKNPSIAKYSSGHFLIVWQDLRGGNYDIYAQLYEFSGDTIATNFKINDDSGNSTQQEPECDFFSNSVICWMDNRNGNQDIFLQLYDSLGSKVNSNIKVNVDSDSIQRRSSVAMSASGSFVVVWQDKRGGDFDIYAQRFDSLGNSLGNNFKINDDTSGSYQGFPEVDSDKKGNFVVVWEDTRESYYDIYAQFYNWSGEGVGPNFRVNDDPGSCYQGHSDVAMNGTGSFIIVWEDRRNGDSDVYAQRYDSDAQPEGGNYRVNSEAGSFGQKEPSVTTDGQTIFFVWQDNRLGDYDIFGKVVEWSWTDVEEEPDMENSPEDFVLYQNYPNPFNPHTTIPFTVHGSRETVDGSTPTTLKIYNIRGQLVRTLMNEKMIPGYYEVIWDGKDEKGKDVAIGIYFYRLKTKDYKKTKKMLLLR